MMDQRNIDLHIHSTASDGTFTPTQVVAEASSRGLAAIALTDHDTVAGCADAREAARGKCVEFIAGCELSVKVSCGELHIVALWVPDTDTYFLQFLQSEKHRRHQRNKRIIERLVAIGIHIPDNLLTIDDPTRAIGRPHIAHAMVEAGYVKKVQEAFGRYLGAQGAAYVAKELLNPEEAVAKLAEFGASIFLAHPRLNSTMTKNVLENLVLRLQPLGLSGIEVYHSSHTAQDVQLCLAVVKKYNLLASGGSDFHGAGKPNAMLGVGSEGKPIPYTLLEKIKENRIHRGLLV